MTKYWIDGAGFGQLPPGKSPLQKAARNDPCPCGSGKKHKKCCLAKTVPSAATSTSLEKAAAFNEVREFLAGYRAWNLDKFHGKSESDFLSSLDGLHARLDPPGYLKVCEEFEEKPELILLPRVAPELLLEAANQIDDPTMPERVLKAIAKSADYDNYSKIIFDPYGCELREAFQHDQYTFELPPRGGFALLFEKMPPGKKSYAPQFVSDSLLYSPAIADGMIVPFISHSLALSEFIGRSSFLHEAIHVMQRVLRKVRCAAYAYPKIRNPEVLIQRGIEDELEVVKIMEIAGFGYDIAPILYHAVNLRERLQEMDRLDLESCFELGLSRIDFAKYATPAGVNVFEEIQMAFKNDA